MSSNTTVVLIDALNIIRRIFEIVSSADEGDVAIQAIRSSVASIRRAFREASATHGLVVFEGGGETWRHLLYPAYKGNRDEAPAELTEVVRDTWKELSGLGIRCFRKDGFEADDVIASVATRLDTSGVRVVIVSNDKDFLQLLSERVSVRNHFARSGEDAVRGLEWVEAKYGVPLDLFVDAMALIGDPVDNIPGIDGIGPKKAARLLSEWGSLDRLIENRGWIKGSIGNNLRASWERLDLSRQLFALKTDIELGLRLSDIRIEDVQIGNIFWIAVNQNNIRSFSGDISTRAYRNSYICLR